MKLYEAVFVQFAGHDPIDPADALAAIHRAQEHLTELGFDMAADLREEDADSVLISATRNGAVDIFVDPVDTRDRCDDCGEPIDPVKERVRIDDSGIYHEECAVQRVQLEAARHFPGWLLDAKLPQRGDSVDELLEAADEARDAERSK